MSDTASADTNSRPVEPAFQAPGSRSFRKWDWSIFNDNPIIIKQSRVRLRRKDLLSWIPMLSLLSLGHMWLEFEYGSQRYDRTAGYILGGMIFFLLIIGAQQTGMLVASTRGSGMLDFHRLSPQSPLSLFVGFLFGGPLREYLFYLAGSVLFLVACVMYGTSVSGAVAILAAILVLVLLFHSLSIVSAMLARSPTNNPAKGAGAAWGMILAVMMFGPIFSSTMAIDRLASEPFRLVYFGFRVPWFLLFMGLGLVAFGFLAIAGVRRVRDDIRPSLSKKQAVAAYTCAIVAGLGILVPMDSSLHSELRLFLKFLIFSFWVMAGFLLLATTAPDRVAYIGGLRRSLRLGFRRPGPFEDRAVNRWALGAMALLLSAGLSAATLLSSDPGMSAMPGASAATIVLVLLEFGLALQYFRMRLGKHAAGSMLVFIFVAWILPVIVGIMIFSSGVSPDESSAGMIAMSVSPFPGILIGSGAIDEPDIDAQASRLAALLPALTAVFTFNMLLTNLQKRIDKRILPEHRTQDADPFAWLDHATPRELVAGKKRLKRRGSETDRSAASDPRAPTDAPRESS